MAVPVITLDGLSGSGKGTYSKMIAAALGWHYLDSGALFRAVAWAVMQQGIDLSETEAIKPFLDTLDIALVPLSNNEQVQVRCNGCDVSAEIRRDEVSAMASKCAEIQSVRDYVLILNRALRQSPGLVADGRDMGTVVFPDATLKFYLEADLTTRAQRRQAQLKAKGISVNLREVQEQLHQRDVRDQSRLIAPAVPADDVITVSSEDKTIDQVFGALMQHIQLRVGVS